MSTSSEVGALNAMEIKHCSYCNRWHDHICPLIKAIEYYPNGTIKRIEFED